MLGTFILSLVGCLYYNKICPPQEVGKLGVVLSTIIQILFVWSALTLCIFVSSY